jgi:hypothetical protein
MANAYKMMNLEKDTSGGDIVSVQWDSGKLENGTPVTLGALVTGETELFYAQCTGATGTLVTAQVYVVYAPEVMYAAGTMISDFYVVTGTPARAYGLKEGSIFVITSDAFSATAVVNDYLIMNATGVGATTGVDLGLPIWTVTGSMSANKFVAQVIEVTTLGYDANVAFAARVIKA